MFRRPGGEFLFHVEKEPKDARGWAQSAGSAKPPCLHAALHLEPHNGGRVPAGFCRITGAQNLSGLCDSSRATSSSRISYPSLRPAGQSSLTPSLLLSNAKPHRWALRWGPPSAACLGGKFQPVRVHWYAWVFSANAPGAEYLIRPLRGHLPLKWKAGAISKPSPLGRFPLSGGNVPKGQKG